MKAWLKCPECGGVFGAPLGESTGECVFCGVTLRVRATIEKVTKEDARRGGTSKPIADRVRDGDKPEPLFVVRHEGQADLIY